MQKQKKGMEFFMKVRVSKTNNGITLIALVITIIVLLILAGVTIATLMGDNGILTKATEARDKTKITEEQEKVKLAVAGTLAEENGGDIKSESLEEQLSNYFADGYYDVVAGSNDTGENGYIVTITENNKNGNMYFVSKDGNTSEPESSTVMATLKIEGEKSVGEPPKPSGFTHTEGTVDEGYVIADENGNEFVWVPVDKNQKIKINVTSEQNIESVVLTDPYGDEILNSTVEGTNYSNENVIPTINGAYKLVVTAGRETKEVELDVYSLYAIRMWELDMLTEEIAEIKGYENLEAFCLATWKTSTLEETQEKIIENYKNDYSETENYNDSINKNGGFYIGRYEASNDGGKVGSKPTTDTLNLWNRISQTDAITNIQSTFNGSEYTSSLLTGSAWDRILCWLYETGEKNISDIVGDSKSWGNYTDDTFSETTNLINTGSKKETKVNNIYDLAGNLWEWTSEARDTNNRINRGR